MHGGENKSPTAPRAGESSFSQRSSTFHKLLGVPSRNFKPRDHKSSWPLCWNCGKEEGDPCAVRAGLGLDERDVLDLPLALLELLLEGVQQEELLRPGDLCRGPVGVWNTIRVRG